MPQVINGKEAIRSSWASLRSSVRSSRRESWLLVYNCQAMGLANCLGLMTDEIRLESHNPASFRENLEEISKKLNSFDRIIVAAQLEKSQGIDFSLHKKVSLLPTIIFDGYHPDICYLTSSSGFLKGPLGDYHSLICFAAFEKGLSEAATRDLYNERVYAELGYLDRWAIARDQFVATFAAHGYDLARLIPQWSRDGAFMYSINHPHIRCLRDLAALVLERFGVAAEPYHVLPHDNLAGGGVFPIYPEIGSYVGVAGNYRFKLPAQYRCIDLDEFIRASFAVYRAQELTLRVAPAYASVHARAAELLEAL